MKKGLLFILFVQLFSCQRESLKANDLENYQILLPTKWKVVSLEGIDSNVYAFITEDGDSIFSDFGKYSQKFRENYRVFSKEEVTKYKLMGMNTKEFITSNDPEIDQSQGTFLKEYYYYDTIDNFSAKIKVPKLNKMGQTGIHFDNIGLNSLTIYGNKLSEDKQKLLIESFKTIKFKK